MNRLESILGTLLVGLPLLIFVVLFTVLWHVPEEIRSRLELNRAKARILREFDLDDPEIKRKVKVLIIYEE